jgi:hypothetical protein
VLESGTRPLPTLQQCHPQILGAPKQQNGADRSQTRGSGSAATRSGSLCRRQLGRGCLRRLEPGARAAERAAQVSRCALWQARFPVLPSQLKPYPHRQHACRSDSRPTSPPPSLTPPPPPPSAALCRKWTPHCWPSLRTRRTRRSSSRCGRRSPPCWARCPPSTSRL